MKRSTVKLLGKLINRDEKLLERLENNIRLDLKKYKGYKELYDRKFISGTKSGVSEEFRFNHVTAEGYEYFDENTGLNHPIIKFLSKLKPW